APWQPGYRMESEMFTRCRVAAMLLLSLVALFSLAPAASADDASMAAQFVSRINAVRANNGVAPLAVESHLTSVASNWSAQMAADGAISHNPNLGSQVSGWRTLGENVGTGATVDSI